MRILGLLAAIAFSSAAFAQEAPKVAGKPLAQVKPKGPPGQNDGTVKGTELWAGDCVASESASSAPPAGEK